MFSFKKVVLFFLISLSLISLSRGAAVTPAKTTSGSGKKGAVPAPIVRGGKSIGPITPGLVRKLNMLGSVVFGARFLFTFDDLAKQAYAATPGPVGKALGKLVGSVLLAHAAVNYQLKNGLKASDTDIARLNTIISTSYLSYHIWGHLADRIQTFDGLITSALLFLLNAFVGYA